MGARVIFQGQICARTVSMTVKAMPPGVRVVRSLEWILLTTGVILLSAFIGVRLYGVIASRYVVAAFQHKGCCWATFLAQRFGRNGEAGRRGYEPVER